MTEDLAQSKLGCEYQERQRAMGDRESIGEVSTSQDPAHGARLAAFVQQDKAFAPQKCVSSHLHLEMPQSTRMPATPRRARQGRLESCEKSERNVGGVDLADRTGELAAFSRGLHQDQHTVAPCQETLAVSCRLRGVGSQIRGSKLCAFCFSLQEILGVFNCQGFLAILSQQATLP